MRSFKARWNIKSNRQLGVILVVFAVTGSTSAYLSKPVLALFGIVKNSVSDWAYYPMYLLLLFPLYQVLLVSFGFVFGQFTFFWAFEKKMLNRIKLGFIADWFETKK